MLGEKHMKNAIMASEVWNTFKEDQQKLLKKYFHLRPTSSGVTIISTLPIAPMRGIINRNRAELKQNLDSLFNQFPRITSANDKKALSVLKDMKFKDRKTEHNELEEYSQAVFINSMADNKKLQEVLNSNYPVRFIASELIFEKGPYRVDIVGFDGKDLFFFELKKGRTFKVEQVVDYRKYYTDNEKMLDELLFNYPINGIGKYEKIRVVMVMRHAENSSNKERWRELSKEHDLDIIFYKPSYDFVRGS